MNILSNYSVVLILRIAHIGGSVLWVGSAIFFLFLLVPAVRSAESAGQKFMQNLGPRMGPFMGVVTTITIVSGALLYARYVTGGASLIWLKTDTGIAFTIGAVAALVSYLIGTTVFGKTQEKIGALGATMGSAGGPPKPEQIAEMNRLQAFLMTAYRIDIVLLVVALVAMAVARYI